MTCAQVEDQIEAVAAGETASDAFREHVEGCVGCASALASARRLETLLASREAPTAPVRFSAAVVSRIRSERWKSEQQVDRAFNALLAVGLLVVVGGIAALLNVASVASAVSTAIEVVSRVSTRPAAPAAPSLDTYLVGVGFFGTALAAWWWAERRLS